MHTLFLNDLFLSLVQVIRLCREHGLYSALIYLFNRGLDDYKTPLEELLAVIQNDQRTDAALEDLQYVLKLFALLHCQFV